MPHFRPGLLSPTRIAACVVAVAALASPPSAFAVEYGQYDARRIVREMDTPAGKRFGLDSAYLDQMLADLFAHAANYPPRFDSAQDQQRAARDVQQLSGMLDVLTAGPQAPHVEVLMRAAQVNSMGHNLGLGGAAEKAQALYQRWLREAPDDVRAHLRYGTFLAGTGRMQEAQPYLERARAAGAADASYALGLVRLSQGDRAGAVQLLEEYQRMKPGDTTLGPLLEAVRNGTVSMQGSPR